MFPHFFHKPLTAACDVQKLPFMWSVKLRLAGLAVALLQCGLSVSQVSCNMSSWPWLSANSAALTKHARPLNSINLLNILRAASCCLVSAEKPFNWEHSCLEPGANQALRVLCVAIFPD